MKLVFERHTFAPELNKVHFIRNSGQRAGALRAPGVLSLRQWRAFNTPATPFIHARLRTVYPNPEQKWLERTHAGSVRSRAEALKLKRELEKRLVPGVGAHVVLETSLAYA